MMHDTAWHGWGYHMYSWWSVGVMFVLILAVLVVIVRSRRGDDGE